MIITRKPMKARTIGKRAMLLVASSLLFAACSGDAIPTTPKAAPQAPNKALVGAVDGTYVITIDPHQAYTLPLGQSYMVLPANAICAIGTSGYGASYWDQSCVPETNPVTITAVVIGAQTDHPRVDFSPAMRFNPATNVNLHIYVTNAATLSNLTVMKYCSTLFASSCVDESLTDPSLRTTVDPSIGLVYRRIKHFSGYLVAE